MQDDSSLIVPFFKNEPFHDPEASQREGRPIYRDRVICEMRIAGDRNYAPVVPAHDMWMRVDGVPVTYAERFPEAYARFMQGQEQVADGTPLAELPFLTEAKRAELRALKVYTAEALASLDGAPLKALGMRGRELKTQATAYLENASGSARTVQLAGEVETLRAELAQLRAGAPGQAPEADPEAAEKEAIKTQLHKLTGRRPAGNPNLATLKEMLAEMQDA